MDDINEPIVNSNPDFKAGFVNLLGFPNAGKSSLMNALLQEKLAIVSSKAQTTRHRMMGIINEAERHQLILVDNPGILKESSYELHHIMMRSVHDALEDADIILYVVDIMDKRHWHEDEIWLQKVLDSAIPTLLVINKVDVAGQERTVEALEHWTKLVPVERIIPISATEKFNIEKVLQDVLEILPKHPPYFPEDQFTDRSERFIAAEFIREKVFIHMKQEIPYSTEVIVNQYKDTDTILRIQADIIVERDTQKSILIGKGGLSLKRIGMAAREEMEAWVGKQVYLELFVKVKEGWRKNKRMLNQLGFISEAS